MTVFDLPKGCDKIEVFRRGDQAVEMVGPGSRWLVVVRPAEEIDAGVVLPQIAEEGLAAILGMSATEVGVMSLGDLLVWSSRRPQFRLEEDPRVCGGGIFNRFLVREALQPFVEVCGPRTQIDLGWFPYGPSGGTILRLISGAVTVVLMSQKPDITPTGERLPVEWRLP